jgi:excisionase family DNA binding protein
MVTEQWLTPKEAMDMLKVSRPTLRKLRVDGKIRHTVISKDVYRYPLSSIQEYLESQSK